MEKNKEYNILIVGNNGVGKTTFINKLNNEDVVKQYKFQEVCMIDTSEKEKYSNLHFNDKIHGAIIMY
jgi:GTPase SAR1 family protein